VARLAFELGSYLMLVGISPKRIIHRLSVWKQSMQLGLYQSYIRPFTIPSSIFSAFTRLDQISGVFWSQRVIIVHRLCALEASCGGPKLFGLRLLSR